jgi:DNA-binding response OmpR family regulator
VQPYELVPDRTALLRSTSEWNCRVLIVEDDEILRAHLRRLLKRARFDVQVAGSADEAMHVLQALRFHILLTDVQMPSMGGLVLSRPVRTGFPVPHLYIHVLTVRGADSDTLLSLVAGADDHIVKGSSDQAVLERLGFARNKARAHCAQARPIRRDRTRHPSGSLGE